MAIQKAINTDVGRKLSKWLMLNANRLCTCPNCGRFAAVFTARQRTMYENDASNFFTGCSVCHEENIRYLNEKWAEYYSGLL